MSHMFLCQLISPPEHLANTISITNRKLLDFITNKSEIQKLFGIINLGISFKLYASRDILEKNILSNFRDPSLPTDLIENTEMSHENN